MIVINDRDKQILKILAAILILVALYYGAYRPLLILNNIQKNEINQLKDKSSQIQALTEQKTKEEQVVESLNKRVEEINANYNKAVTKQDFIVFIGNECKIHNLHLEKFEETMPLEFSSGVYKNGYGIEVRGLLADEISFVNDIDALGIPYTIKNMSLRDKNIGDWEKRILDKNILTWYNPTITQNQDSQQQNVIPQDTTPTQNNTEPSNNSQTQTNENNSILTIQQKLEQLLGNKNTDSNQTPQQPQTPKPVVTQPVTPKKVLPQSDGKMLLYFNIEFTMIDNPNTNSKNE